MPRYEVSIPDAVWVATAILHQKRPDRETFSTEEIRDCVIGLKVDCSKNPRSINDCINADCVANNPATKRLNNHCKLFRKGPKKCRLYRLYRRGEDEPDPSKDGCPVEPTKHEVRTKFQGHVEWYHNVYSKNPPPVLSASGSPDPAGARVGHAAGGVPGVARTSGREAHAERNPPGVVDLLGLKNGPLPWATEVVVRAIRDTAKVRRIKKLYKDRCQVCEYTIQVTADRRYSEVHHLRPLGHGGDDDYANMLVLCPTHHVEFDYAVLGISKGGRSVVDRSGGVRPQPVLERHSIDPENIAFHLKRMGLA